MLSPYTLVKPFLFSLDPEQAHDLTMGKFSLIAKQPWLVKQVDKLFNQRVPDLPVECMGLDFRHPVGLAAGLDKDARAFPVFSALGFSSVEMGTVTPKPQPGNDKPRLFRLLEDEGLINRMGFNSAGIDGFLSNLARGESAAIAGVNVGKNAVTSIEDAHFDYVSAMQRVYSHADYITINISSPNTKSLRELQNEEYLDNLLLQVTRAREKCEKVHKRRIPVALKVAPDLEGDEVETIGHLVMSHKFDAVIATNTTVARPDSLASKYASEAGGLSGAPVKDMATQTIREFRRVLKGRVQIIGVGGIADAEDAWEKLLAGADYLQLYTQFIYKGPGMINEIVSGLQGKIKQQGFESLQDALDNLREG